jgi:UDP-3-O-[3-hydroxymyristoyl] glucosamine N-acyltransferase LpxD
MVRATLHEQEIREAIGVPGEGDLVVDGVSALETLEDRCVCFANLGLPDGAGESLARRTGCILIVPSGSAPIGDVGSCRVLETADPRAAVAKVLGLVRSLGRQPPLVESGQISPQARISPLAVLEGVVSIAEGVEIEPFCTVGPDVSIGRGSVLAAGARVYPRVSIGEDSAIGPNAVIGHEGLGFVRDDAGNKVRIPHLAGAVIGSHVEVGALTHVQAGVITPTTIEDHAKIDTVVVIGHGARVGRGASVTGGVVMAGSSVVGEEAWIGINSSVREGRQIGSHALVGMDASVQQDVPEDAIARAPRPEVEPRPRDDDREAIGFAWRRRRRST